MLALDVVWNDGALAVLHDRRAPADSLVIREIGQANRHTMGESGVARVLWHVGDPAGLDSAEELLTRRQVRYQRHRDTEVDGITMHDPDRLEIVLLWICEKVPRCRATSMALLVLLNGLLTTRCPGAGRAPSQRDAA